MKEIILDTETTGLSVKDGHRIVEIGCIELDNLVPTKNIFHCYLNPERKVSEKAFEVHGYSDQFLSDKKKFFEIAGEFLNFIKDKKIIIHNENTVDTLDLARNKFPGSGISLDALCRRFRIDNSKREKHSALIDCELLAKVYINLLDQKEPKLNFSNFVDINSVETENKNITYSKKIVYPTSEELEQHREFLKRDLKKNFY